VAQSRRMAPNVKMIQRMMPFLARKQGGSIFIEKRRLEWTRTSSNNAPACCPGLMGAAHSSKASGASSYVAPKSVATTLR
jgi:hypothetical protein